MTETSERAAAIWEFLVLFISMCMCVWLSYISELYEIQNQVT